MLASTLLTVDLASKSLALLVAGEPVDLSPPVVERRPFRPRPGRRCPQTVGFPSYAQPRRSCLGQVRGLAGGRPAVAAIVVFTMGYRLPPEAQRRRVLAMILAAPLATSGTESCTTPFGIYFCFFRA